MDEYTDTVEITEISDPTPEEEAAVRAAHGTENSPEEDGEHGDEDGSEIYRGDEEPEEDWIRHFHLKIEIVFCLLFFENIRKKADQKTFCGNLLQD